VTLTRGTGPSHFHRKRSSGLPEMRPPAKRKSFSMERAGVRFVLGLLPADSLLHFGV